jgi:hypothetical protein
MTASESDQVSPLHWIFGTGKPPAGRYRLGGRRCSTRIVCLSDSTRAAGQVRLGLEQPWLRLESHSGSESQSYLQVQGRITTSIQHIYQKKLHVRHVNSGE